LKEYLEGSSKAEMAWLSPDRQFEEAWFLGLRLNGGVELGPLRAEFGEERTAAALVVVERLAADGLVSSDGARVCLSPRGRLMSNDVFQEFLGVADPVAVERE